MEGLEILARNLKTHTASTDGMRFQKPTPSSHIRMEDDDDDDLFNNIKSIFKKKFKANQPSFVSNVTNVRKPTVTTIKPTVMKPTVCSKSHKSKSKSHKSRTTAQRMRQNVTSIASSNPNPKNILLLWKEACKMKSTIHSKDMKYSRNKFTCYTDDSIWIYVSERKNGVRDLYLRVLAKKVTLRSWNEISRFDWTSTRNSM